MSDSELWAHQSIAGIIRKQKERNSRYAFGFYQGRDYHIGVYD